MSEIEKPILTVGQDQFLKGKSFDTYKKKLEVLSRAYSANAMKTINGFIVSSALRIGPKSSIYNVSSIFFNIQCAKVRIINYLANISDYSLTVILVLLLNSYSK